MFNRVKNELTDFKDNVGELAGQGADYIQAKKNALLKLIKEMDILEARKVGSINKNQKEALDKLEKEEE